MNPERCEVLVIGSGPGGAITACLLAEAGRDVLLVESGPNLRLADTPAFSREEMERKYCHGGVTAALGKTKVAYIEGRCVGGGSEVNAGLYHRTPPDVLDQWSREFSVEGLSPEDMAGHFEACERDVCVSPMPGGEFPKASVKLHDGATRLGWKSLEVPRWFRYDGRGGGTKQSMTETFIPRALKAGCRLRSDTSVKRLAQRGNRWTARTDSGTIEADTVFVACGAVRTPALLRRSGIKRNIGDSLRLHPTVKLAARFEDEVSSLDMGIPVHQVKEFSPRLSFGCSISAPPHLATAMIDHPDEYSAAMRDWKRTGVYYVMTRGGSGTVRNLPGFRDPLVRFKLGPTGLADLADGMGKLATALFESGATVLYPTVAGMAPLRSRADLESMPAALPAGGTNLMTIHMFSSCPMGEDLGRCATDSFGRVHGTQGLHINDASLLCGAPGVNPQGSIMAVVRRNALRFLQQS